jgi:hypothetical protein
MNRIRFVLTASRNKSKEIQMKNEIRLALLCLATVSVPVFAQNALPRCGASNFDRTQNAFTVRNASADAVNQQCLITVYPKGAAPAQAQQDPASYFVEGKYTIDLIGGGGGGGGGGAGAKGKIGGTGGGGASAAPSSTVQYLPPGDYKLTIGTGGEGGAARGGRTESGNPTSLTNANTGQLIAGFPGADTWTQKSKAAGTGAGGVAAAGGTSGASGQAAGASSGGSAPKAAQAGGGGGPGLIRLTMAEPAPQASAPAPVIASSSEAVTPPARAAARPARKDRN